MQNPAAPTPPPDKRWFGSIRLVQSVYEGGRIKSGVRTARLTKEQSQARYRAALADALLQVRTAYFDALLAEAQLHVIESSAELLRKQEEDARHRFEAGLVQKLDVLRAGVELANTAPKLARARHQLRLAQMRLANLTGLALPADAWSQPPFKLADPLHAEPLNLNISAAITRAFENRPEIEIQRKLVALQKERLVQARSGFKPSVQAFTGYGAFNDDLDRDLRGWFIGAQVNWDLFDGLKTQGRIREAEAELGKAELAAEDLARNVELEVRTAWSRYLEAQEILDSHKKVVEQAEEAWRLANSRFAAGEIAQLDLLTAQTALTEARATSVETLRDYNVALAQLEKAVGIQPPNAPTEMTK
jgi:outer membrane protein TolC